MMNMFKKVSLVAVALGTLTFGATGASAATRIIGGDVVDPQYTGGEMSLVTQGTVKHVAGGNIKVVIPAHKVFFASKKPTLTIEVLESDNGNGDDFIGYGTYNPLDGGKTFTFNVDNFVDGDNNMAEVYIKYRANYDSEPFNALITD